MSTQRTTVTLSRRGETYEAHVVGEVDVDGEQYEVGDLDLRVESVDYCYANGERSRLLQWELRNVLPLRPDEEGSARDLLIDEQRQVDLAEERGQAGPHRCSLNRPCPEHAGQAEDEWELRRELARDSRDDR